MGRGFRDLASALGIGAAPAAKAPAKRAPRKASLFAGLAFLEPEPATSVPTQSGPRSAPKSGTLFTDLSFLVSEVAPRPPSVRAPIDEGPPSQRPSSLRPAA